MPRWSGGSGGMYSFTSVVQQLYGDDGGFAREKQQQLHQNNLQQ